jgi:hypothetical protein
VIGLKEFSSALVAGVGGVAELSSLPLSDLRSAMQVDNTACSHAGFEELDAVFLLLISCWLQNRLQNGIRSIPFAFESDLVKADSR